MKDFANVKIGSHNFVVEFEYTEGDNCLMNNIEIIEVALKSKSGSNDRVIHGYDKIMEEAVKDIHDCYACGDESDYGEWDGPRIGEAYDDYEGYCADLEYERFKEELVG